MWEQTLSKKEKEKLRVRVSTFSWEEPRCAKVPGAGLSLANLVCTAPAQGGRTCCFHPWLYLPNATSDPEGLGCRRALWGLSWGPGTEGLVFCADLVLRAGGWLAPP